MESFFFFFFLLLEIQRNYKNLHFLPKPKLSFQNPIEIGYSRDRGGVGFSGKTAIEQFKEKLHMEQRGDLKKKKSRYLPDFSTSVLTVLTHGSSFLHPRAEQSDTDSLRKNPN